MRRIIYFIFALMTAMITNTIHGSIVMSVISFFFAPFFWIYWFLTKSVNLTIIKESFSWFFT